ncbi:hypothetical protein VC83_07681 [Pseudogymnoascus destructans]|uniref:Rho-GAP domain-containing protein n=1 Tax=Pseudogymnoascus destructans TaxID=655981 RepID=A0A177A1U2_9PEZI|nr:uncharacterized protein VC83_07681 [Pseudogymnoascus destructans]OAF55560.1 hypothetical protein VC83_07681 [Pseudogymnoascus destructans]
MGLHSTASYGASAITARGVSGEDMTIAQGLLAGNPLGIPSRRGSEQHRPPSMNQQSENLPPDYAHQRRSRYNSTSNTWTSSSEEETETDDIGDRTFYIGTFNKLARDYGIPELVPDNHESEKIDKVVITGKAGSWIMKKILRRTTSLLSLNKARPDLKHRRSISDISLRMGGAKKDAFKDRHLAELVRLCGSSNFDLPPEYAHGTLSLPTCFRSTAQYLVQHGPAMKGIFRISGSHATVAALYDHYASQDEDGDVISDTVRCPTLPENIRCDEHDVASTFKKFLSGLPGGILGKVWLFEALVTIHDQMGVAPDVVKTRQTKVRPRMIASAIASHPSRFQRDLICAVFGLLSMIGRASETARREDSDGRPLPTNELMGYGPLGTLFGPLLVGDLIYECNPCRGEVTVEISQGRSLPKKKSRHRKPKSAEESLLETKIASDKLKVAGGVAEMLITHWRDVVKQMRNLRNIGSSVFQQYLQEQEQERGKGKHPLLKSSTSEYFLRRPPDWNSVDRDQSNGFGERNGSPTPPSLNQLRVRNNASNLPLHNQPQDVQQVRRQRSRPRAQPNQKLSGSKSMSILTPPREDNSELHYEHLDCGCPAPKATVRAVSGVPPTENETISSGDSLYRDLLSSLQSPSENSAPPDLRVAPTTLLDQPLIENVNLVNPVNLDLRQTAIVGRPQEVQTPIKTQQTQGPNEAFALNDNITNTTTVEHSQDEPSTENSEIIKETEDNDMMQLKKKQPIAKRGTPKVSKATKVSPANQQSDVEDGLPPRISRLPGYSPSEHLERRKLDQIKLAAARDSNDTSVQSQESDTDSDLPPPVRRIPGQSPSEHLERILSANIPESVGKHSPAYKSNGSAFRSGGSSRFVDGGSRGSLMMSEVESGSVRVSHEQDMASLASLAQVLNSESNDEFQSLDPSGNTTEFVTDYGEIDYTPTNRSTHKHNEPEGAGSKKANQSAKRASFAADLEVHPSRLNHAPANLAASSKKNTAGIQSLIGKFNTVDQDAVGSLSPSPTRSPATFGGRYSIQFPITAPSTYAMNSSPILSRDALKSSKGFGNETSQLGFDREVASPKSLPPTKIPRPISASLLSITHQAETQLPIKALNPTKKQADRRSLYMDGGYSSSPVLPSLGSFRDGGANENMGTPGRSGRDKMRSKPAGITIWDDSNTTPKPRSTSVSSHEQPSVDPRSSNSFSGPQSSADPRSSNGLNPANTKPGPSATTHAPITPAVGTGAQGKGTSVLFSQITNLQRLLEARTEEADNLKKQLATKGSLNDLSTLAEQLREAKRETATWQKRAEMAERHLERLSQFNPATISEAMAEESAYFEVDATRVAGVHEFPIVGKRDFRSLDIAGPAQHGNVEGARSSGDSTNTQGTTIMRTIPELRELRDSSPEESVASYGAFGRQPRKLRGTSGEDLITFSETD